MSHWPCVKLNAHTVSMSAIEAGQKERDETETVSAMASLSMQQPTNLTYVYIKLYRNIKFDSYLFPLPFEIRERFTRSDFSELPQNIPEKFPRSRWNRTTPNEEEKRETGRRSCIDPITRLSLRSYRFFVERE